MTLDLLALGKSYEALTSSFALSQDPDKFCAEVEAEQQALREKLVAATKALPDVVVPRDVKLKISEVRAQATYHRVCT